MRSVVPLIRGSTPPLPPRGPDQIFFLNFEKLGFKMLLALISTGILLASWKFREITSLFKNCLSSKFQLPRPCGALVVVDPLFEEKYSNFFSDFVKQKSSSCGKSTIFNLASWKFREITSLFKNCIFSKFQLPRPCGAPVSVNPLFEKKFRIIFLIFWNKKVHRVGNPQFSI